MRKCEIARNEKMKVEMRNPKFEYKIGMRVAKYETESLKDVRNHT